MGKIPQEPVNSFECAGSAFDMGYVQGQQFKQCIQAIIREVERMDAVRLMKPAWLPLKPFVWLGRHRAAKFLSQAFERVPVSANERLQGIASGAGIQLRELAFCNALEAALSDLTNSTIVPPDAACSAVAATRSATHNGEPLIAHNFDYLPMLQPHYLVRRSSPDYGMKSVELIVDLMPGVVAGVNEAGFAITCNYAYATDKSEPAPTISMLAGEALATLKTVDEAEQFFSSTPRTGGGLIMLGDASGEIASLEISNRHVVRRNPQEDRLSHSNRYSSEVTRRVEIDHLAAYGSSHPLDGCRVHESADSRDAALARLLRSTPQFDSASLQNVMSDHGPEDCPSADSVCMHSDYWYTTASLQILPTERSIRASFSPACIAEYTDFTV